MGGVKSRYKLVSTSLWVVNRQLSKSCKRQIDSWPFTQDKDWMEWVLLLVDGQCQQWLGLLFVLMIGSWSMAVSGSCWHVTFLKFLASSAVVEVFFIGCKGQKFQADLVNGSVCHDPIWSHDCYPHSRLCTLILVWHQSKDSIPNTSQTPTSSTLDVKCVLSGSQTQALMELAGVEPTTAVLPITLQSPFYHCLLRAISHIVSLPEYAG